MEYEPVKRKPGRLLKRLVDCSTETATCHRARVRDSMMMMMMMMMLLAFPPHDIPASLS
jgi:hypothetical protein